MFRPYLSQSSSGSGRLAGKKKSLVKEEVVELCRVCETVENLVDISTESYSHLNEKLHRLANFEGNCSYLLNFICKSCSLQLENAFSFKARCENTYKKIISQMIINTVDPLNADPLGDAATQNYGNVKKEDRWTDDDDSPAEDSDNYFNDTPQDFMEKTEEIKKETVKTNNKKKSSGYTYKPKKRGKMVWTKLPDNYEIIIDKRRRWTCAICGRAFQEKWILKNHIKGLHSSDKPHACDLCDNKYSLKSALKRHKMTHEDAQIPCDVCGKTFRNLLYMKKHRKHNHSGEKPPRPNSGTLICQTCGHVAKNRNTLVAHLRIHAGTKPFKCEVCKKGFLRKQQLDVHRTIHSGERSFLCHLCSKSFRVRSHLNSHIESHNAVRKHKCNFCDKSYSQTYSLKLHIKNEHTGEPRYECPKCFIKFRDRKERTCHTMGCSGVPPAGPPKAEESVHPSGTTVIVNSNQIAPAVPVAVVPTTYHDNHSMSNAEYLTQL